MGTSADLPIVVIAGPTASGKSEAALHVAEAFEGAVINADSMQVYRELSVLTARPGFPATARVPHLLYGCLSAADSCSAGKWLDMAVRAVHEVRAMGRMPVVVGGTGLYIKALTEGLAPIPSVPERIRARARELHAEIGGEAFRDRLAEIDPEAASRIEPADTQRLLRAYEVARGTGRTLSQWQREESPGSPVDGRFATIVLMPPRESLYAAIDARFDKMVGEGALDEVQALRQLRLDPDCPAMKAVGVRELTAHIHGETTLEKALESAKRATRQYAKRQFTWLRHQTADGYVLSAQYSEREKEKIFPFIRQFLLTATF
ncbi:MAG: tRNA (adenosine(37)-N6)-dimethylallyltransferase MiaA [Rhodospirillales bacterium]|nr:tRNA (adenosine(37)-N6)-dimethylallyltransferase MiaA [Rhodospirillales bacterium]